MATSPSTGKLRGNVCNGFWPSEGRLSELFSANCVQYDSYFFGLKHRRHFSIFSLSPQCSFLSTFYRQKLRLAHVNISSHVNFSGYFSVTAN